MNDLPEGRIVTFYSYKGGTGRTMALANVAWILASNGLRVLVVDWDLESPGLHKFFQPFLDASTVGATPGVIEFIRDYAFAATTRSDRRGAEWHREYAQVLNHAVSLEWDGFPGDGTLDFISAGKQNRDYSNAVSSLDWDNFYDRLGGGQFFDALRVDMKRNYDYILIDSRTGLSDIADICTVHFPDTLVMCFTLSDQGIDGAAAVARHIDRRYHDKNIRILPVPMRIDQGEKEKLDAGRTLARASFDPLPSGLTPEESAQYWADVEIPYQSFYAFEETLATFGDKPGSQTSLLAAYERLTAAITGGAVRSLGAIDETLRLTYKHLFERRPPAAPTDVFLSYAPEDRMWADWIEALLNRSGFRVHRRTRTHNGPDAGPDAEPDGLDVTTRDGTTPEGSAPGWTVVLLSAAYQPSPPTREVRAAIAAAGVAGADRHLVPVRVGDVRPAGPFANRIPVDLVNLNERQASEALLRALDRTTRLPEDPAGQVTVGPRFPGRTPAIWNVPTRNAVFTGRDTVLEVLRDQLVRGNKAVVLPQALYGLGGVGKTQVALEYVHRFKADYDLVWWVSADQVDLVNPIMAELADRLGIQVGENVADAARAASEVLRLGQKYPRWLLVFDNAGDPAEIEPYLPAGSGHVLITSRNQAWSRLADPLEVDVFSRQESVEHLLRRASGLASGDADKVASVLGDLPLAIEQAAAWLDETGMPAPDYLDQLANQLTEVLAMNSPTDYPLPVVATWNLSFEQLREKSPAAARLLQLCAFFAPEAISMALLYSDEMVEALVPLDPSLSEKLVLGRVVREIGRFALMRVDQASNTIHIHRLVQAVIRDQMTPAEREDACHEVHRILLGARPRQGGTDDPENWPRYDAIWPHLAPSGASDCDDAATLQLLIDRIRYLRTRGEFAGGLALGRQMDALWSGRAQYGPDDPQTLHLRFEIGNILRAQGRYEDARALNAATLATQRRVLTERHPHTLMTAGSLAADLRALGEFDEALVLARETYANFKELFGEDHPSTLSAANNLAVSLRLVGDCFTARDLDSDTLVRRRIVLGPDHPHTLSSAANLARDLREAGEFTESIDQLRVVLADYRRVLGEDSPDTLRTAKSLAVSLRKAGLQQEARQLTGETYDRYLARYDATFPGALSCALNLACDLSALDDKPRARDLARDAMASYAETHGAEHPYTLGAANNLSTYLRGTGELEEAFALADRTYQALRRKLGDNHPFTLSCAVNLANCLGDLGQLDEAATLERLTLTRIRDTLGETHPDALACQANLALTMTAAGRTAEARHARERALVLLRQHLGPTHPNVEYLREGRRINRDLEPQPV